MSGGGVEVIRSLYEAFRAGDLEAALELLDPIVYDLCLVRGGKVVELGQVFTIRDGQLVSYRGYLDRAEALEAAGLSE
jgi:hypothetical protein